MTHSLEGKKTGEDIAVDLTLTIDSVPDISVLPQILVSFYFLRKRLKFLFSHHALNPLEVGLVTEAAAEGKTINTLTLNGSVLEMVIPKEDTDTLVLSTCEFVTVFAEVTYFDDCGAKSKSSDTVTCDVEVLQMIKSSVEGLI